MYKNHIDSFKKTSKMNQLLTKLKKTMEKYKFNTKY